MINYDAVIIGTGISGSCVARELAKYKLKTAVLEKAPDLAYAATRGNSATIHAGHDASFDTLKGKYNVLGNAMYDDLCAELNVPFNRNGYVIFAKDEADLKEIRRLKENADKNGVPGVRILTRDEMNSLECLEWSDDVIAGLYAPTGGMTSPYSLAFALCENAAENGTDFFLNTEVQSIKKEDGRFIIYTDHETFGCNYIFNCAGTHADEINNMLSRHTFRIIPRKGSHLILDRRLGRYVHTTWSQTPSILPGGGHTKGMGVMPTVDGTVILGCEAITVEDKDDSSSTKEGLDSVVRYFKDNWKYFPLSRLYPDFPSNMVIGAFAGIRPHADTDDFIIGEAEDVPGLFNMAGIESPGLTSAPAIAKDLVAEAVSRYHFLPNEQFNPIRQVIKPFREMTDEERSEAIAKNPDYGCIVCRCELITKAEIKAAIHGNPGAASVNSVKMRTRAGMGRCQGGFCSPEVVHILSEELGIPMTEVLQSGKGSNVLKCPTCVEETKEGGSCS